MDEACIQGEPVAPVDDLSSVLDKLRNRERDPRHRVGGAPGHSSKRGDSRLEGYFQ